MNLNAAFRGFGRILVCAGLLLNAPWAWSAEAAGLIRMARGEAFVERAGTTLPARTGMAVQRADLLRTGPDGRIAVRFADGSRFALDRNSRVSLDRFEFNSTTDKGAIEASVDAGTLAISTGRIVKKTPGALKIRTPTTILGARGTEFIVEVSQ